MPEENTLNVFLHDNMEPVLGASVLLYNDTSTVGRGAPVDENGVATIDRLHSANYQLHIYAENDGYFNEWYSDENDQPQTISLSGDQQLEIELTPSSRMYGLVVDGAGTPVYGAEVYASNDGETLRDTTSADGSYELWGLYEGDWTVQVSYQNLCPQDPSFVTIHYPNIPDVRLSEPFFAAENTQTEHNFVMPNDNDFDGMSDEWERDVGLDPTQNDAMEDPDDDGISNLDEYYAQSNPFDIQEGCSCSKANAALLLPFAFFLFRRKA